MQERQRRQEEEQESEEEEEAGGIQQQADAEDEEDWGELAVEDLGPEARSGQYAKDWERRAKWGMLEIFTSMPVQKLRELVEGQEEWSELAANIMRVRRKVEGESTWVELEKAKSIAPRLVNFIMTGDPDGKANDSGPLHQRAIKELLKDYCDDAVRAYVEDVLKPRYQNVPRSQDPHKLMWKLWHYPRGPANDVLETLLGSRELEYEAILGADLEPNAATGNTAWPKVWQAIEAGKLTLVNQEEVLLWLIHVNDLSTHPRVRVSARLTRQPGNRKLRVSIYQIFSTSTLSSSLISGTWQRKNADTEEDELVAVDLRFLLSMLDGFDGSPFMEQMDRLTQEYEATENEVTARGVEGELSVDAPMNLKQFDKVMACVEDVDRGEPAEFREECSDAFLLTLRPYQRRSLAHMLREERALGGSSRNLWVKLNLPEHPDVQCYVSPILHQIRSSTSRIEAEQWVNANGGAGWIALEMGMGKTACAVGAIQMNPPPKGWRKNRAYQTLRARDHLSSVTNNMPHGGTLVVMPPTLIDQWEQEIHKTTDQELSILKWTENKGRQLDCKLIAEYDVVLTTFQNAANLHTLSAIYWWRIVVDEPQLNAGKFLGDHNHDWFAQHRWLLTGTPINATVESMDPSLDFLKLGTYDALYSHYPPVIAHVLKSFMVRYTKAGVLDGETNLQLPPVVPRTVKCDLSPIDQEWYRSLQTDQKNAFYGVMASCRADPDYVGEEDPQWEFSGRKVKVNKKILKIRGMLTKLRQAASSGLKQDTGEEEYDAGRGCYIKLKHWYQSKAEAVIEVLEGKDPEEKVLVFSEFPATLQAIKALLPSIGLQSRNLIGSSSAASRGKAIRDFQTDPPTKVFLLTYRAGGAGITLTAGTHIILCEPTLNPSFEKQAIGRSHRMGQTKPLTVTRMLMLGTIEEKVAEFVERQKSEVEGDPQQQLESTMMETNQAANDETNKLTIEELRDFIYKIPDEEDE